MAVARFPSDDNAMLCTSGFVDDVIFYRIAPVGQNQTKDCLFGGVRHWRQRERSLVSMLALFV